MLQKKILLKIPKPYYELLLNSETKYVVEPLNLELFLSLESDL